MPRNTTTKGAPSRRSRRHAGLSPAVAIEVGICLGADDHLSQLPLEILTMILAAMNPIDVISISRTCKAFRRFLYNPKASRTTVWKPVLESIEGLPPCPRDLNEPQYVALLYNCGVCAGCGKSCWAKGIYISPFFELRLSLCDNCAGKEYSPSFDAIQDTHPLFRGFKSKTYMKGMGYSEDIIDLSPKYGTQNKWVYHIDTVATLAAEYNKKRTTKTKQAWMEEKRCLWGDRNKHGVICRDAMEVESKKNELRRREIGKHRVKWMMEKLAELGWEEEAQRYFKIEQNETFIYADNLLTNQEWTVIQPRVICFMEEEREKIRQEEIGKHIDRRIQKSLKFAFTKFVLSQPPNEVNPNILDVALSDEWRTLLCTEPFEDDLADSLVDAASEQIPEIAKAWRKDRTERFLEAIRKSKSYSGKEVTEDTLLLASTVFRCTLCRGAGDVLTYPHTLVHYCHFLWLKAPEFHIVPRDTEWTPPPKSANIAEGLKRAPIFRLYCTEEKHIFSALERSVGIWDGLDPHIVFDDAAHEHMLSILDTLGWSRDTTAAEMEEKQPYVECLCECYHRPTETRKRKVFRWKKAVFECKAHKEKDGEGQWFSKLNDEENVECKKYEAERRMNSTHLSCPWCNDHRNMFPYDRKPDILRHITSCRAVSPLCSSEARKHVKNLNVMAKEGPWLHYEASAPLKGVEMWSSCRCRICDKLAAAKTFRKSKVALDSDSE